MSTKIQAFLLLALIGGSTVTPAYGQMSGGHYGNYGHFSMSFAPYSPVLALIAGILVLIFPKVLNYIVAIYLIIIGLAGILLR